MIWRRPTADGLWLGLCVLVSVAWAGNLVVPWMVSSYKPDASINNLFMVVVGGVVALRVERSEARHRHESDDKEESK